MKLKALGIIITCICMCLILVGCNDNKNNNGNITASAENKDEEQVEEQVEEQENTIQNTAEETDPKIKIANTWMKMPQNVDLVWRTDEEDEYNYSITQEYKRGNDILMYPISVNDGQYITGANGMITNEYYYYHYLGNYTWSSYVYYHNKGWDTWYFKGNYPPSTQSYSFGKVWNILDNYSDDHKTINIEGVGEVDTVKGVDDSGYTYYYSKDLNMNVRIENNIQAWYLTKFDTNVSSDFPYALPDMQALDAKADE